MFETVALLWLLPAQRARRSQAPARRTITLAGSRFALADITRVKAAEHYLEMHGKDGINVIRERMATFLEQVEPDDGIQTHRSHWVAVNSAVDLNGSMLRLVDGEKVPVARGRLNDVRSWLQSQNALQKIA